MNSFEIIIFVIFITVTIFIIILSISTLQLIKELKTSLKKINRLLDHPQNLPHELLKKFEETLTTSQTKSNSSPHFFHRQKQ